MRSLHHLNTLAVVAIAAAAWIATADGVGRLLDGPKVLPFLVG